MSGGVFVKLVDCGGYLVNCRAEICPQVQVYFKKLNCKKSGGIFVKLVDCGGYLLNLASTEYRSITEKFKGFLIKLMDSVFILTKHGVFLENLCPYLFLTVGSLRRNMPSNSGLF